MIKIGIIGGGDNVALIKLLTQVSMSNIEIVEITKEQIELGKEITVCCPTEIDAINAVHAAHGCTDYKPRRKSDRKRDRKNRWN